MKFQDMLNKGSNRLNELKKRAETTTKGGYEKDTRFWEPTVDDSGTGSAVIRFLMAPKNEDYEWISYHDHFFKAAGGYYVEKCRSTLKEADPVQELVRALYATERDDDKKLAGQIKRRTHFVSNIYVVSDPKKPENEGKVFLFRYGKKIFNKINDAMNPEFPDEPSINPFHPLEGANFRLKIRNVENFRNYDKSEFEEPSKLANGDMTKMEAIWNAEYGLSEFVDPKNHKPYEELQARLLAVLGPVVGSGVRVAPGASAAPTASPQQQRPAARETAPAATNTEQVREIATSQSAAMVAEDDDDEAFFRRMREGKL